MEVDQAPNSEAAPGGAQDPIATPDGGAESGSGGGGGGVGYPPPCWEAPAPSVVEAVLRGRDLRMLKPAHRDPFAPALPPPRPARPVCPACTQAVAGTSGGGGGGQPRRLGAGTPPRRRCRHAARAVCSNRLAVMSKPQRRRVLAILEEHGHTLPPEKLQRFRDLLVEETTFMPDEAYDYFLFLRKARKNNAKLLRRRKNVKIQELRQDEKLAWARDAAVVFARGVRRRLLQPASYRLTGGMLDLSDVVLQEVCRTARARAPPRSDTRPRARFLIDLSDKIAVWIDQILADSDERMLMVDVDEDEDVLRAEAEGNDFADMMGAMYEKSPAFAFLMKKMREQNDRLIYSFGGIKRTYAAATDELEESPDLKIITVPNKELADRIRTSLKALVATETPPEMEADMKGALHHCPVFLSQKAVEEGGGPEELARRQRERAQNYVKGDAFHLLVNTMRQEKAVELYDFGGVQRSYEQAADELANSKSLVTSTANGELAEKIRASLTALMSPLTPKNLQEDMLDTLEHAPNYLSQKAVDEAGGPEGLARRKRETEEANKPFVKGAAFDLLLAQMINEKSKELYDFGGVCRTYEQAADELVQSPDLKIFNPNKELAVMIRNSLTALVETVTPAKLQEQMKVALLRVPNFLSQRAVDEAGGPEMLAQRQREAAAGERKVQRDFSTLSGISPEIALVKGAAFDLLVEKMKSEKGRELYTVSDVRETYRQGGDFLETTNLKVTHPNKELAHKIRNSLIKLMQTVTPTDLQEDMKAALIHAPELLSQKAVDAAGGPEQLARLMRESEETKGKAFVKGPAFDLLVENMMNENGKQLYDFGGVQRTFKQGADELVQSADLKCTNPNKELASTIRTSLTSLMRSVTPASLQDEMNVTLEYAPNFLSQIAVDQAGGPDKLARLQKEAAKNKSGGPDEMARRQGEAAEKIIGGTEELVARRQTEAAKNKPAGLDELIGKMKTSDAGSTTQDEAKLLVSKLMGPGQEKPVDTATSVAASDTAGGRLTERQRAAAAEAVRGAGVQFIDDKMPATRADPMLDFYEAVRVITITEMQKRGDSTLIDLNHVPESYFFAAQRLKKADKNLTVKSANAEVAAFLRNKIEEQVKCHTPRKYTSAMKEYVIDASMYLSERVTQPDKDIEAYVLLLQTMEDYGVENFIITENFKMNYEDAAQHLRGLLTFEDELSLSNAALKTELDGKLKNLVAQWHPSHCGPEMDSVIGATTPLLVSHVMVQAKYNDVLNTLVGYLKEEGDRCLLIFGDTRRTYGDAAQILAPMHAYELARPDASPIFSTKLEIKLRHILEDKSPTLLSSFAKSILKNASQFLAVKFFEPDAVNICHCARSVGWDVGNIQDAAATYSTDPTIALTSAPFADKVSKRSAPTCNPDGTCFQTTSPTVEHVQVIHRLPPIYMPNSPCQVVKLVQDPFPASERRSLARSGSEPSGNSNIFNRFRSIHSSMNRSPKHLSRSIATSKTDSQEWYTKKKSFTRKQDHASDSSHSPPVDTPEAVSKSLLTTASSFPSFLICQPTVSSIDSQYFSMSPDPAATSPSGLSPVALSPGSRSPSALSPGALSPLILDSCMDTSASDASPLPWSDEDTDEVTRCTDEVGVQAVVDMDQMLEWSGMMMSLMWNVHSWRRWVQSVVERVTDLQDPKNQSAKWEEFKSHVDREVAQWRQRNLFSRMFAQRVASKCKDRKRVPGARGMERKSEYEAHQQETMHIIDMFEQWMQWLTDIVKETDSLLLAQCSGSSPDLQYHEAVWSYFKGKIEQNAEDLRKYDHQMKQRWEENYQHCLYGMFSRRSFESVGDAPGGARVAGGGSHLVGAVLPPAGRCHVALRGRRRGCHQIPPSQSKTL